MNSTQDIYFSGKENIINVPHALKAPLLFGLTKTTIGACTAYDWLGTELIVIQNTCSFRKRLHFRGRFILSWRRKSLTKTIPEIYQIEKSRAPRVYLNIGSLPFDDNSSGIPRVAKELSCEALKQNNTPVFPIYADPKTGVYKFALQWVHSKGYCTHQFKKFNIDKSSDDPKITLAPGDWIIHTMINPNEIDVEKQIFSEMRALGVKIGFVLHDIIAERRPEFFRKRDQKTFGRWLRKITDYDGIFAVSKATRDDFLNWAKENNITPNASKISSFFLGSNFQAPTETLSPQEISQLEKIKALEYCMQVSTIEPRKGYKQLLEAFDLVAQQDTKLALVIVGRQGWKVQDIYNKIRHHPLLNKQLFWFAGISDSMLQELYKNAKLIVACSENEGFGLPVVEAGHFKKPLLARDIPVFREVAPSQTTFFHGQSPQVLASAILKTMKEPSGNLSQHSPPKTWSDSLTALLGCITER